MSAALNPSGFPFVRGNLTDLEEAFAEDFNDAMALGGWYQSRYATTINAYEYGWPDSMGNGGFPSGYDPKIISVANGCMVYNLKCDYGQILGGARKMIRWSANVSPKVPKLLYGAVEWAGWCFGGVGWKMAPLFWSDALPWPQGGEIDGPEAKLGGVVNFYLHFQHSNNAQFAAEGLGATLWEKHKYLLKWTPDDVSFFIDDVRKGYYGPGVPGYDKAKIPSDPMHFQLQSEQDFEQTPLGGGGTVYCDWMKAYRYKKGVTATAIVPGGTVTPGNFNLTAPALTGKGSYTPGETLNATVAYANQGGTPFTVNFLALSLRGPAGERLDLVPGLGTPFTVAPGATRPLTAALALPATAAPGAWAVVSTWQGTDGVWRESPPSPFAVAAAPVVTDPTIALKARVAELETKLAGDVEMASARFDGAKLIGRVR